MSLSTLRIAKLSLLALVAAAGSLVACGDETTSASTSSSSSSSGAESSSSSSSGGGGAGGAGSSSSGAGGAGGSMCVPGPVAAKTIKGMVTYSGAIGPNDVIRVSAFKDGVLGPPAGNVASPKGQMSPYAYELTVVLPPENTAMYGVAAVLDVGGDSPASPGAGDKTSTIPIPMAEFVTVDDCQGATKDITINP